MNALIIDDVTVNCRYWTKTWSGIRSCSIWTDWTRPCWAWASVCGATTSTRARCSWRARPASVACASTRAHLRTSPIRMLLIIPNSDLWRAGPSLLLPLVIQGVFFCFFFNIILKRLKVEWWDWSHFKDHSSERNILEFHWFTAIIS